MNEWPVPAEDLEGVRQLLAAALTFHEATDIANAQKNLSPETRYSPLTNEIAHQLEIVKTHLKEWKFAEYEAQQDEEEEEMVGQIPGQLTLFNEETE